VFERASDGPYRRYSLERGLAEDLLRALDVGACELLAGLGEVQAAVLAVAKPRSVRASMILRGRGRVTSVA
jgi:hypothetical protein